MKSKKSPIKIVMIISLIIVALIVALVVLINNNNSESNTETSDGQPSIEGQPTMGESDAPVTVVEFGDFKCPACKVWGENILPQLVSDYVDTGDVEFSFINVLFHGEESQLASLAAESVYNQNPDAYWDYHEAIFEAQPSDSQEWVTKSKMLELASSVSNIDTEQLETAIDDNTQIDEVNKDTDIVNAFDIQQTPTIMINGIVIEDPFNYESIQNAIDSALEAS
ncbi:DsbA family protein [Paraliobacillus zengyii]|uniref:DsbA family protein n=1 Tax=Paraliobacillus zengyii TaxID=2213194 RepID=UPI000DD4D01E|nr:DsbA family protein [Paraliobacillus zengyii]